MESLWTVTELVAEVGARIAALPTPRNGQVRAVPDERTIRYYAAIGLLDRPAAMRGRTALYSRRHVAQIVAIKRLQTAGRSLSEIRDVWPTLDPRTLSRMSGVALDDAAPAPTRAAFWKREPRAGDAPGDAAARPDEPSGRAPVVREGEGAAGSAHEPAAVELRIELAPHVVLSLSVVDDSVVISPADVRALRVAAAPLLAELAARRLAPHPGGQPS